MNLPGNTKYLVNLLESHIQMNNNQLTIKRGGYIQITDKESEHEDVIYALRNKWAKLQDTEPTEPSVGQAPEMTFVKPASQGASSIEELLAMDTKVETKVEEVKEVKVEATKIEEEEVKEVVKTPKTSSKSAK